MQLEDSFPPPSSFDRPTITHDQIARRAYELWLAEGCPGGRDIDNWIEAERQLRTGSQREATDEEGLAVEVEKQLDELTERPAPRSVTSLEL